MDTLSLNAPRFTAPQVKSHPFLPLAVCVIVVVPFLLVSAAADTINGSTSSGGWTFSGAGATNGTPFIVGQAISFTNNATRTGTFASGASLANFDGFWTASFSFFLPSVITDISGSFANLFADDRVVLSLNGNLIGKGGLGIPSGSNCVNGAMEFSDSGGDQPLQFCGDDSSGSASGAQLLALLNLGGMNTLEAVINNTGGGVTGITKTFGGDGDGTRFRVDLEIAYNTVPEPSEITLLLTGASLLLVRFRRLVV